jgi:hypothetical protein
VAQRDDEAGVAEAGRALIAGGLHARGLAMWAGTATLARLPARLAQRASAPPNASRAAFLLELLVAGRALPLAEARARLGLAWAPLLSRGVLEERGGEVIARRAVVPLGAGRARAAAAQASDDALAVCDRWDAAPARDGTPWPDDSSHHLCGALAGVRAERWLDLGTGSGLAPLTCRQVAPFVLGAELVVPTARAAALGAALSDHRRFHVAVSDLDDAIAGEWDLVTCNAPIPDEPASAAAEPADVPASQRPLAPRWRHAEADFLERLCARLPQRLRHGGLAVVHARHDALERAVERVGSAGDLRSVVYTPAGVTPFSVTWWQPHLPARRLVMHRALDAARPHIDERDRLDAASAGDNNRAPPLPEGPAS